eukprot:s2217_g5.t1
MGRSRPADAACKFCKLRFDKDKNPLVKKPGANDTLKPRCANARDCRPCYNFIKNDEEYAEMTTVALLEHLENPDNQKIYDEKFHEWCETRREGGRRARTRGAIEVSSTSSKTAKQISKVAEGGSSDDDAAAEAFEQASKKLRVTASSKDDEISLSLCPVELLCCMKVPGKTGPEDDELMSMLWGGDSSVGGGGAVSDDETAGPSKKKAKVAGAGGTSARARRQTAPEPKAASTPSSAVSEAGGSEASHTAFAFQVGGQSKKNAAAETRELDKSESLVLLANQLKLQVEDGRGGVMQLSYSKATSLLEKLETRLSESTALFVDMIKSQGPGCRAETVWHQLKDCKALVQAISDFLEALQDKEAAPATLSLRATALRDLKVSLPSQVNNAICQRTVVAMCEDEKLADVMEFIDPDFKDKYQDGITCVLPKDLSEDAQRVVVREFQGGCIIHAINQSFLRATVPSTSDASGKAEIIVPTLKKILTFAETFVASKVYASAAPEKSALREDVTRLIQLLRVACADSEVAAAELESADGAKVQLTKGKSAFQSALTIYPLGVFLCETVSNLISQSRKDQALQAEILVVSEFAQGMKPFSRDAIVKERDGEYEVSLPQQAKIADMTAKYFNFKDNASDRMKKKFPKFEDFMEDLTTGKLVEAKVTECLQMLGDLSSFQCLAKLHLAKLLGKENASNLEGKIGAVTSISRLVKGALGKLCALAAGSVTEEMLFDDKITALFKELKDLTVIKQLGEVVPSWATGISKMVALIEKSVATFMEQATSTFHGFVSRILAAEVNLDEVLQTTIVGAFDQDDKDRTCLLFWGWGLDF